MESSSSELWPEWGDQTESSSFYDSLFVCGLNRDSTHLQADQRPPSLMALFMDGALLTEIWSQGPDSCVTGQLRYGGLEKKWQKHSADPNRSPVFMTEELVYVCIICLEKSVCCCDTHFVHKGAEVHHSTMFEVRRKAFTFTSRWVFNSPSTLYSNLMNIKCLLERDVKEFGIRGGARLCQQTHFCKCSEVK